MNETFKKLLTNEVNKAKDELAALGNCGMYAGSGSNDQAINDEWTKVLDNAYELIAQFADKHSIEEVECK